MDSTPRKVVINMEVLSRREPELYSRLAAVPEVCHQMVIRSLLETAIQTPMTQVAAMAARANAAADVADNGEGRFVKKLTFWRDRPDDAALFTYFDNVPVMKRRQAARTVLMKGFMEQSDPVALANASVAPQMRATASLAPQFTAQVPVALAVPARQSAPPAPMPARPTLTAPPALELGDSLDGFGELFGAVAIKG